MKSTYSGGQMPYFDKSITKIIKGIALILMFAHHFFTFPSWWVDGIDYPFLEKISPFFNAPLRLCVPIFCFLTGYLYFFNRDKTFLYSIRKITDILIDYWCVLFLFAITAIVLVHYHYTPLNFALELFALDHTTMYFCWYVFFYCVVMLVLPVLTRVMSISIHFDMIISLILLPWIIVKVESFAGSFTKSDLLSSLTWFPMVLIGYIFARYNLFGRIAYINERTISSRKFRILLWIIAAVCVPMGRYVIPGMILDFGTLPGIDKVIRFYINLDILYAPIFIYCIVNLCLSLKLKYTQLILKEIGKNSLLMWFASCIFFGNAKEVFQPILYWLNNPILVLAWGLLLCYVFSRIINRISDNIKNTKNGVLFRKSRQGSSE